MKNKKNSNKRIDSATKYVDAIMQNHSKVNIVRVDLSYTKPHSGEITLEEANKDVNHLFNNMRSKPKIFEHKVGYILKREYTEDKGVHFHGVIIFDGQKVQKGAFKADEIGKYWEQVTDGKGSYHNCHRNNYERNGIGMIDHRDSDKRKILYEDVISYLCKDEQDTKTISENKKDRSFTRGTIPKSKGNIGRPRE